VAPVVCDLDVGHQHIKLLTTLGLPDHLFIKKLAAALPHLVNDTLTMAEVVPKFPGVKELKFLFLIAEQLS
jgi:hypothetical protein